MPKQTIFWKHDQHGSGSYVVGMATARDAGENAADELPADLVDDESDEFNEQVIRENLTVKVWTGEHLEMPSTEPDYELV